MEKITLKALQLAGFQNAAEIAKIVSYVPNPQVAVEMLLGVHTPIDINPDQRFRVSEHSSCTDIIELIDIDELADKVSYTRYEQKTKYVYYLTREDRDKNIYVSDRPEKYYDSGRIPTTGYSETKKSTSIQDFNNSYRTVIPTEQAFITLTEWENYGIPQYELTTEENELPF